MADTGVKSGVGCCVCFLEGFSSRGSSEAFKLQVAVHAAFLEQVVSAFFFFSEVRHRKESSSEDTHISGVQSVLEGGAQPFGSVALLHSNSFPPGHGWSRNPPGKVGFICPSFVHLKFASSPFYSLESYSLWREGNASCDQFIPASLET